MTNNFTVAYLINGDEQNIEESIVNFSSSYMKYSSGIEHELYLLIKNRQKNNFDKIINDSFVDCNYKIMPVDNEGFDIGAYYQFAKQVDAKYIFLINTNSFLLTNNWLKKVSIGIEKDIDLVGTSASYEQLKLKNKNDNNFFAKFPNPHIRTNGFMIKRKLFIDIVNNYLNKIQKKNFLTKLDTYRFESGKIGLTSYLLNNNFKISLIGANGRLYNVKNWPVSNTFRLNEQENLLISDRQTRFYDSLQYQKKKYFNYISWGNTTNKSQTRLSINTK